MDTLQFLYLPLAPAFFLILIAFFFFIFVLLPLGLMQYAYEQLGVSPAKAVLLLLSSLIGSYINIPIAVISQKCVMASQMIDFYGMRYQVPAATEWGGTVLAVNVGGAIIPIIMSVYLLIWWQPWIEGLLATAAVTAICYWLSSPVPGVGIAVPVFVPVLAATIAALALSRMRAAPVAFIAGSLGTNRRRSHELRFQRLLQSRAVQISNDLAQVRFLSFAESENQIPTPFLAILSFWLVIVFASYSLFSPLNITLFTCLSLFAFSAACAIFLILELSRPFTGLMMLSSAPLQNALGAL